jgi:hypothetical protein
MRYVLLMSLLLSFGLPTEEPPTWKGLQCIGWSKTEADSIKEGESTGEELVVNTPLTRVEKHRLVLARRLSKAAYEAKSELEHSILKNHGYEIDNGGGFGDGPCGEFVGIRVDEYHITQFVPSNSLYPSDSAQWFAFTSRKTPAYCREYFAKLRKQAVAATYGTSGTKD